MPTSNSDSTVIPHSLSENSKNQGFIVSLSSDPLLEQGFLKQSKNASLTQ